MQYKDWYGEAIAMSGQKISGRKIAKALGKSKTQVNDVLKANREGKIEYAEKSEIKDRKLKYLYFDLESSLMRVLSFGLWKQNIQATRIKKHSHLLTAAWAVNDGDVESIRLNPDQVGRSEDLDIVLAMIKAINSCDVVVTFNGKKFDSKLLNTRALAWGLPPIVVKKHIDLMQLAKSSFRFPSNSMQNISTYLGLDGKIQTGSTQLWERCDNFENFDECEKALIEMETYNRQDIVATRDLHYRLMGWGKNQPNIGTIVNSKLNDCSLRCSHCGSDDVAKMELTGYNGEVESMKGYTSLSSFDLYRCGNTACRGVSRISSTGKQLVNNL